MAVKEQMGVQSQNKVREPKRYHVVMHNDDFTPMDFVVYVLVTIFLKEEKEAVDLMLQVHNGQKAVIGTYSYDIAHTRVNQVMEMARKEGYPFRVTVEEE